MIALAITIIDPSFRTFSVRLNGSKIPSKVDDDKFIIDWEIPPNTTNEEQLYIFELYEDDVFTGKTIEVIQKVLDHYIVAVYEEDGRRENIYSVPLPNGTRVPIFPMSYIENSY